MAEDIIIRYRAEVDELKGQLDFMIKQNEELGDSAASTSDILKQEAKVQAKANEARIAQIKELKKQLESLERARKAAFEPAEIADYDKQIKQVTKDIQTLKNGTTDVKKGNDVLTKSFKGIGASIAAAFTVDAVIRFANQSIEAFQEAEEAAKRLDFTIRNIGGEGESEIEALNEQARELSQNFRSVFSTQDIQKLQTQLSQYGLLTDQIEDLTPAILDLASAQGVTLEKAASDVIQAIEGQGRALKQVGIVVDSNQTTFERYEDVLEGLGKFTGAAAEETQTYAGELKNLEKDIENISVRIGETIAPAFQRVKVAAFEAAEGIIDLFTVTGRRFQAFKTASDGIVENSREVALGLANLGFSAEGSFDELQQLVQLVGQNVVNLEADTKARIKNARSVEDLQKIQQELSTTAEQYAGFADAGLITTENQIVLNRVYQRSLNEVGDAIQNFKTQTSSLLDTQTLNKLSTQELIKLLEEYGKKTDVISRSNVEAINEELKAREKSVEETIKYVEALKKANAEIAKTRLGTFIDGEEIEKEAQKAADAILDFSKKGGASIEASTKIVLTKLGIQFDSYLATLINARLALTPQIDAAESEVNESGITFFKDRAKIVEETTEEGKQAVIDSTIDLSNQLTALYSSITDSRIQELDREFNAVRENYNREQEALETSRENRLITQEEFNNKSAELERKLLQEEQKANEEKNKLLRKQALVEKANAVFQIGINTEQAISRALAEYPFPFSTIVAGIVGALAAVSLATVIATPIPKFAKGTKGKKDSGMAIVGEEGPEMTFLPKGAKVLPAKQTRTYSQAFDAMYDGTFDKYIDTEYEKRNSDRLIQSITRHKEVIKTEYITPVLQEQKRKYEQVQSERFADNVAHSITVSNSGLYWDLENIRKKGQRVVNADDIGRAVAKEVGKVIQSRRRQ